ncbi:SDR family NAD(P)-dependent oxidoreductase [Pseudonocardia acaciae]|uniref:SDR family NAD(P)-dependent oxidoreductase n=1 Tax=Pseudonocardia acaciae TaxID=551276 RepID=UPI0007E8DCED|nr:SDR family oxidoreductase [Pseudonocardia acaciae]
MLLLEGRTALVTGAGGRLGRRIVARLAAEGASVAALDLDREAAERAPAARSCAVVADVRDPDAVENAVAAAENEIGPLDVLVNAHGIFPNRPVLDITAPRWDEVFAVNVRGTMLACQAVARRWVERGTRGAIVTISSGAATSARAGGAHYAGSKAAVNMLVHTLAIELGPHGIRVNAVAPGLVLDEVLTSGEGQPPYFEAMLRATPLRRTGDADDVAQAVAFLASDRSAWTTGAILEVTGGSHCGRTHVPYSGDLQ